MDQARATKQWLQKQFQSSGIQTEPAALARLVTVIEEINDPERFLRELLDEIETNSDTRKVTLSVLEEVLGQFEGRGNAGDGVQVINVFKAPLILYDPVRKLFHHSTQPRKLFAEASSKTQLYVDRFLLIHQRLQRHVLFRPVQWSQLTGNVARKDVAELTELKALLGLVGERRYVTGFLTRQDEGRYFIEDLSARLPLDLSIAETADGLFTENCVVVAEGELTPGGSFRALAVGLPPAEPRAQSLAALQGLDFFGGKPPQTRSEEERQRWATAAEQDRIVILSDVHLDRPEVLDNLHTVLKGFSSLDALPSTFVLMGNFQSYDANAPATNISRIRDNFATLGRIIRQYPSLLQHSRFLIVPGPGDIGPGDILPRPVLPKAVTAPLLEAVPSVLLCTNPCRIRHGPAELVLFRNNLQRKMRGLCILPPPSPPTTTTLDEEDQEGDGAATRAAATAASSGESPIFDHLCATVLQESHLCPVPLEYQPVAWELDHSLWVYPLPDGLVLADAEPAARYTFDTCSCLNPGSLLDGTFGAWKPTTNEMELCDVAGGGDDDEDDEEDDVEEVEVEGEEVVEEGGVEGVEVVYDSDNGDDDDEDALADPLEVMMLK